MKPISTDLENILQSVQLREDEYLDEESKLIYCSRCRTPRQKRFEIDKSRISIRLTAPYSDDRRKAASELAKKRGIHTK